jgi:membrane protease YdiL (CAAX protease family)
MRYDRHERLVAPARPSSEPLRLLLGMTLTVLLFLSFAYLAAMLITDLAPQETLDDFGAALDTGTTPVGVLANLYIFGLLVVALAAALRTVHHRSLASLLGPWPEAIVQFRRVCLYLVGLHIALSLLLPGDPAFEARPNLAPGLWLTWLPLALPALLIQTGAEELAFRGYMQSQLAARFSHPLVWMLVPSLCFGILHHDPVMQGGNTWLVVAWAVAFGIATADLTARAGTLGPAIAFHFINNIAAILLVAPQDSFDGLALYTYPFSMDDTSAVWAWAPVDLMVVFCGWLTARLAIRR